MSFSSRWDARKTFLDLFRVSPRTPGTLGLNDQADPNVTSLLGGTPGPLGSNDGAQPGSWLFPLPAIGMPCLGKNGALLSRGLQEGFDEGSSGSSAPTDSTASSAPQMPLDRAQELALRITTYFEGGKSMNYKALADDFDGQGTSFGLIQWNFGQNTLGPLLKKMLLKDPRAFANCFGAGAKYEVLKKALTEERQPDQIKWARDLLKTDKAAWRAAFEAIGSVQDFHTIQREQAIAKYHPLVEKAITVVRSISTGLMKAIEFRSYAALFDLCVQQNGIEKKMKGVEQVVPQIKTRIGDERPAAQIDLMKIVVVERAKKASTPWVSDCISRRMGILTGGPFESTAHGFGKKRNNPEFHWIGTVGTQIVTGI